MSAGQLAVAFFLQMAVILAACRVVAWRPGESVSRRSSER